MLKNMMTSLNSAKLKSETCSQIHHIGKGHIANITSGNSIKQLLAIHAQSILTQIQDKLKLYVQSNPKAHLPPQVLRPRNVFGTNHSSLITQHFTPPTTSFWSHSHSPGTGNCLHKFLTSPRMRACKASSSGVFSTCKIQPPMVRISAPAMPRVVKAGVPMRIPEGSIGLR